MSITSTLVSYLKTSAELTQVDGLHTKGRLPTSATNFRLRRRCADDKHSSLIKGINNMGPMS
jgi:hypothetical protein